MVKTVLKLLAAGALCLSERREVGRNQMVLICQLRHQLTEHVAAAGESVQQKDRRILWVSSLAIKDNGAHRLSLTVLNLNSVICYILSFILV